MTVLLIFGVIFALFGIGLAAVGRVRIDGDAFRVRGFGLGLLGFGVLLAFLSTVRIVGATNVGVPTTFGHIGEDLSPGLHLTNPFTSVHQVSTRLQEYTMVGSPQEGAVKGDDSIPVLSSDGGSMNIDVTVKYRVDRKRANELFRTVGGTDALNDRIVRPEARAGIRDTYARYTAVDGYSTHRQDIGKEIEALLHTRIDPRGVLIDSVNIRNIRLSDQLQNSNNQKLQAQQDAAKALFAQQQAKTDADTKRVVAQGDADAQRIRNSVDPTPAQLAKEQIEAIKPTDKIIITNGNTPVIVSPAGK